MVCDIKLETEVCQKVFSRERIRKGVESRSEHVNEAKQVVNYSIGFQIAWHETTNGHAM